MEILDLYDDLGNKLNETIIRGTKTDKDKNIMLSIIFIKNKDNKYLIQKTSKEKGSKFSTTGGHVSHNEDGLTTIIRELEEELGIKKNQDEIKYITIEKIPNKNCIFNVYLLELDNLDINNIKLQEEEVESVSFLTIEEINKIIDKGSFLESHAYFFKKYIQRGYYD